MYWRNATFLIILTTLVYLPGMTGGFVYDDWINFVENNSITNPEFSLGAMQRAMTSGMAGPLGRPLPMLSFYLNHQFGGTNPDGYKTVNLVIHLVNTVLVFLIALILVRALNTGNEYFNRDASTIAFWVALLWAIHPINLTAVLYTVQRMTSMAGLFTLLGMLVYCRVRTSTDISPYKLCITLIILIFITLLAGLCKENGVLLLLFLLVIELSIFQFQLDNRLNRNLLLIFYGLVFLTPLLILLYSPGSIIGLLNYEDRDFSLIERALTQPRVVGFYISQIIIPRVHLFSLHHDDFIISTGLFEPVSTVIAIAGLVILLFAAVFFRKQAWFTFGVLLFFTGHLLESTVFPLNIAHEHRNYLPSFGLIFLLVTGLFMFAKRTRLINPVIILLLLSLPVFATTFHRAYIWGSAERFADWHITIKPRSVNANHEAAFIFLNLHQSFGHENHLKKAGASLEVAIRLSKNSVESAIALLHVNSYAGKEKDEVLYGKIKTALLTKKIKTEEIIALRQLMRCNIIKKCNLEAGDMLELFSSILENPGLNGRDRDDTLFLYAEYLDNIDIDVQYAINIMQDIVSRNPDLLEYRVGLIKIYLRNNKRQEAEDIMRELTEKHGYQWKVTENTID